MKVGFEKDGTLCIVGETEFEWDYLTEKFKAGVTVQVHKDTDLSVTGITVYPKTPEQKNPIHESMVSIDETYRKFDEQLLSALKEKIKDLETERPFPTGTVTPVPQEREIPKSIFIQPERDNNMMYPNDKLGMDIAVPENLTPKRGTFSQTCPLTNMMALELGCKLAAGTGVIPSVQTLIECVERVRAVAEYFGFTVEK
jgi:hypothetical protein